MDTTLIIFIICVVLVMSESEADRKGWWSTWRAAWSELAAKRRAARAERES